MKKYGEKKMGGFSTITESTRDGRKIISSYSPGSNYPVIYKLTDNDIETGELNSSFYTRRVDPPAFYLDKCRMKISKDLAEGMATEFNKEKPDFANVKKERAFSNEIFSNILANRIKNYMDKNLTKETPVEVWTSVRSFYVNAYHEIVSITVVNDDGLKIEHMVDPRTPQAIKEVFNEIVDIINKKLTSVDSVIEWVKKWSEKLGIE